MVFEPVNQIARARNTGAAAASGDWLLFVDADSRPERLSYFEEQCWSDGTGDALPAAARSPVRDARAGAIRALGRAVELAQPPRALGGGVFIFCEAAAFREAGGFSEQLYAAEEIDLFTPPEAPGAGARRLSILHRHPLRDQRPQGASSIPGASTSSSSEELVLTGGRTPAQPRRLPRLVRRAPLAPVPGSKPRRCRGLIIQSFATRGAAMRQFTEDTLTAEPRSRG